MADLNEQAENMKIGLLKASKIMLHLSGLLSPVASNRYTNTLYKLYTISNVLALVSAILGIIIIIVLCRRDLLLTTHAVFWLLGYYIVLSNLVIFVSRKNTVLKIVDKLEENHIRNIRNKYVKYVKKGEMTYMKSLAWRCLINAVLFVFIVITQLMASSGEEWEDEQEDQNVVKYRFAMERMAVLTWTPLDIENDNTQFVIMYAISCYYGSITSLVDIATDNLNYSLSSHLSAQFEILCDMVKDVEKNILEDDKSGIIFNNSKDYLECKEQDHSDGRESVLKDDDVFKNYLMACIKKHQDLLELSMEIDSVVSPAAFFLSAIVPFTVCGSLFLMLSGKLRFLDAMRFAGFTLLIIYKMLIYCIYGEEVQRQSENVKHAIYSTDWFNRSPKYRKLIKFMIMRSDKPATLTAWIFDDLSMETFGNVMNKAYTYFTFLLNFTDN